MGRKSRRFDRPSIIIVEALGYGGGDNNAAPTHDDEEQRRHKTRDQQGYDPNSMFEIVGSGEPTEPSHSLAARQFRQGMVGLNRSIVPEF